MCPLFTCFLLFNNGGIWDCVDDVDGGWSLVGDLGDVDKPLDVLEEGEELPIGGRIE